MILSPCPFDIYYLACELCGGGLIFGAFFMATDYVTSPMDQKGQLIYGILLGVLTGLFRFFGTSAEGVSYAIILSNLLVPLIDKLTLKGGVVKMKKIIKDILILCVITIICGGLLGYVYQITKNPIQHQLQQSKQDAYLKVMKEATSFKTYKENDIKKLSKKLKGDYGKNGLEIENALKAYHQKQTIGYIIQVIDHDGFGGDIEIIVGINLQKEITGVEIYQFDETVGLGMNAKNEEFRNQYVGKKVDHFQVVKNGKQNEDEVDSLSGATITSKAMTNGINGALDFYDLLKGR